MTEHSKKFSETETKISIHPIVILTISDYYTRIKVISNGKINRVFGGLLGQNKGNKYEIFSAFEFYNQTEDDSKINLDLSYIDERRKLTEQLFPNYEIVGFFMTNDSTSPDENSVNEVLKAMDFFGVMAPLCLVLSTDLSSADELPVSVYQIERNLSKFLFYKLAHIIEGFESERVCLDTVTKSTDFQNNESAIIQNMQTFKSALDVLKSHLKLIKDACDDEKFYKDPHFIALLDEMVKNYPNVNSIDMLSMLTEREEELMILNNICADSINISLQGKIDSFGKNHSYEEKRGFQNFNFNK